MANYHFDLVTICRDQGKHSSVAASAYRSGLTLTDERTGLVHDYSHKRGVEWSGLVGWDGSRSELWNATEEAERRGDSRLCRELVLALPHELGFEVRKALCLEYAETLRKRWNVAIDVNLHLPGKGLSQEGREKNFHVHFLITSRTTDGKALGAKVRELDLSTKSPAEVTWARKQWEQHANAALAAAGIEARIDCRSRKDKGEDRPARIHLGHQAAALERDGLTTHQGNHNRSVDTYEIEAAEVATLEAEEARLSIRLAELRCVEVALSSVAFRERVISQAEQLEAVAWAARIARRPRAEDYAYPHVAKAEAAEREAHARLYELDLKRAAHPIRAFAAQRLGLVPSEWRKLAADAAKHQRTAKAERAHIVKRRPDYEQKAAAGAEVLNVQERQAQERLQQFAAALPVSIRDIREVHQGELRAQREVKAEVERLRQKQEQSQQQRAALEAQRQPTHKPERVPDLNHARSQRPRLR